MSPRRAKILLALGGLLLVLYAIAGFFIAPRIIRPKLAAQFSATLHRSVTVGPVRVNPFALSVRVDSLRVVDRDGSLLAGWDECYVNLEILSAVRREVDLLEVRFVRPYGKLVIRRDGTMNVSDIVNALTAADASGKPSAPPPVVSIDGLHIDGARLEVIDSATRRPFQTTVGPWRIDLASFATRRDATGRYSFSGSTESGETFAWAGSFAVDPVRSSGEFSIDSVRAGKYGLFYEHSVGFDIAGGTMGVKAKYDLDLGAAGRTMRLIDGVLRVRRLAIVERGRSDTVIALPALEVAGVELDGVARRATVGSVTTAAGVVNAVRARDSSINLSRLIVSRPESGSVAAPSSAGAAGKPSAPPPPWRWLVARIAVDSYTVTYRDSATVRPARLDLDRVTLSLDSVASDSNATSRLHVAAAWQGRDALGVDGTIKIWKRAGDLMLSAKGISLRPIDAYLAPAAQLLISEGRLTADARLRFDLADSLRPDLGIAGDVRVDRLATVDVVRREPFFDLRAFRMRGIDYAHRAKRLTIKEIALDGPVVQVGVAPDGTPVMRSIFPRPGADSAKDSTTARDRSAPPPPVAAAPTKSSAASASSAVRTSIGSVRITDGAIKIADRSVQPVVAFNITKINAQTGRLSSDSLGTGTLELTASIDEVAPVRISGRFNPLSDKEGSDLTVNVQGWELVPVGPYSGKYLGYLIAKGKMKMEMQYRVVGRKLQAENKLTLDEFTFGDQTQSPEATKMPVKLGFSIMRDRDGQIVFDVPVEGDLDDPDFRLGRVIGRAILNVLTKLVTSPFKLLGGMFGGGDADLSYAEFAPGSSALAPADTKKLDVLAKSLYERPALKLEIAGAIDTLTDPAALRGAKLDARLRVRKWTALKAKDANAPPPDSLLLTPSDRPGWLAAEFVAAFPKDSAVLAARKTKSTLPPYPPAEMEQRLLATIDVTADDLRLLAADRAKRCLDYLLTAPTPKVEAERAFLTQGAMKTDGARAVFSLQ